MVPAFFEVIFNGTHPKIGVRYRRKNHTKMDVDLHPAVVSVKYGRADAIVLFIIN